MPTTWDELNAAADKLEAAGLFHLHMVVNLGKMLQYLKQ